MEIERRYCSQFDDTFLKALPLYKLQNIRRILYDGTKFERRSGQRYVDYGDLRAVGPLLRKYSGVLTSLREVVVCGSVSPIYPDEPPEVVKRKREARNGGGPWLAIRASIEQGLRALSAENDDEWRMDMLIEGGERMGRTYLIFRNLGSKPRSHLQFYRKWHVYGAKSARTIKGQLVGKGPLCDDCIAMRSFIMFEFAQY